MRTCIVQGKISPGCNLLAYLPIAKIPGGGGYFVAVATAVKHDKYHSTSAGIPHIPAFFVSFCRKFGHIFPW